MQGEGTGVKGEPRALQPYRARASCSEGKEPYKEKERC